MKKTTIFPLCAGAVFFMVASMADATVYQSDWTVVRHVLTSFSNARLDAVLKDGNSRLGLFDYSCVGTADEDVPCALRIAKTGDVGTFGLSTDNLFRINTAAELNAVWNANPGKVVVVDEVNWCGEFKEAIIGCGQQGGNSFVVEATVQTGVFLHEFGHNKNLVHRDSCQNNIMVSETAPDQKTNALIESECVSMGGKKYVELTATGGPMPLNVDNEPFWARTNITVPSGQTLNIGRNVNIQFNAGVSIKGKVIADGRNGPIRLYSNCSGTNPCPR